MVLIARRPPRNGTIESRESARFGRCALRYISKVEAAFSELSRACQGRASRLIKTVSKTSVFETDRLKTDHPAPATLRRGAVVSKEVSEPIVSILIG